MAANLAINQLTAKTPASTDIVPVADPSTGIAGKSLVSDIVNYGLPSQAGNSGKFLTTNGTISSWASVLGSVNYQGTWDASTNSPSLASGVGTKGFYYVVSADGSTNLDGVTSWKIGDWAIYNGTAWQKVDNTDAVTSVNGYTGTVSLNYSDVGSPSTSGTNATGTWAIDITGNSANVTGIVAVANGGTGKTTASDAINALVPTQTGNTGKFLKTDGSVVSWADNPLGTVTSVGGTGTVNGLTLTGTVTTSGNLTLGGTLSGIDLTTQITGILPVANGGTGTSNGSITGTGELNFAAGGTNQSVIISPTGTGAVVVDGIRIRMAGTGYSVSFINDMSNISSGAWNVGVGGLTGATTGSYNTATGYSAIAGVFTSNYTTAFGYEAGYKNSVGPGNLLNDPEGCTYIGAICRGKDNYETNAIVIGYDARGKGSNTTVLGNSSTTQTWLGGGELRLPGSTSGYVGLKGAAAAGSTTYTLPSADGTSGQVLSTNGTGTLSWTTVASSGGSVTSVGGTGTVNGITLTGTVTSSGNLTLGGSLSGVSLTTQVSGTLPIANGGTGQTTASAAFNALSPLTTLGDVLYASGANTAARLAGNTTSTKNFLSQTGTGSASAAPAWSTVSKSDVGLSNVENTALSTWAGSSNITTLGTVATGTWNATAIAVAKGGTGATDAATARTNLGLAIGTNIQAWDADLDAIAALAGTSGLLKKTAANTWSLDTTTYLTGNQTITLSGDASGSGSTSIAVTLATVSVSKGGTGATTLTGYVKGNGTSAFTASSTVPGSDVSGNISGNAANVTGTVAIANGGTGQTTANASLNALLPSQTSNANKYLKTDGTNTSWATVSAGPAGSSGEVQYNSSGSLAGAARLTIQASGWPKVADSAASGPNMAIGTDAISSITTGNNNTAFGINALKSITTSVKNVAFGKDALKNATNGFGLCSAFGHEALLMSDGSSGNTAIGATALKELVGGYSNTAVGTEAGWYDSTGNYATNIYNCTMIGRGSEPSGAYTGNEVTLGNSSIGTLRCAVTSITSLSDARDKTNITPMPSVLSFIASLNPVRFDWWTRDGAKIGVPDYGFIAQELQQSQNSTGFDWAQLVYESNPEKLEASPGKLIPILVKAIQELAAKVAALEAAV